jgi:hypothetical protein
MLCSGVSVVSRLGAILTSVGDPASICLHSGHIDFSIAMEEGGSQYSMWVARVDATTWSQTLCLVSLVLIVVDAKHGLLLLLLLELG